MTTLGGTIKNEGGGGGGGDIASRRKSLPPLPPPIPNKAYSSSSSSIATATTSSIQTRKTITTIIEKPKEEKEQKEEQGLQQQQQQGSQNTLDASDNFLISERQFVEENLRWLYETFYSRLQVHIKLKRTIIDEKDVQIIFGNIETLYVANNKLYADLLTVRMEGREQLRDKLGTIMQDFIPYLKVYTDYIVKTKDRNDKVEELKANNKKFRKFVKINEQCAKRKLKSLLDAPVSRLPQYLQNMANVYKGWENDGGKDNEAAKNLLKAIVDIKKMTDEIATKCRDQKARRLVGQLQKDIFNDKILLTAAHRLCIRHGELKIVKNKGIHPHIFILCNDILAIGTPPSRWKSGELVGVFPLIGLRVLRNPSVDETLLQEAKFRFAIIPQNKNFTPNDSTTMGSVVILCEYDTELEAWIDEIEEAVDEEEHNLRPCNPVDLEKRLRREPTSPEGSAPTITITDPSKIEEVEEWKQTKISKIRNRIKPNRQINNGPPPPPQNSTTQNNNNNNTTEVQTDIIAKATPPLRSKMLPPSAPAPPPTSKRTSIGGIAHPPPRRTSRAPNPPSRTAPPSLRQSVTIESPRTPTANETNETDETNATNDADDTNNTNSSSTSVPTRANLLGAITTFRRESTLKKVTKEETQPENQSIHEPQDVASLLQSTLANYRAYVQDESDNEEPDDDEWK